MSAALLHVREITRRFGGITALDGVTFGVERSSICGLIGPNGAGKTTLINVISGLTAPSSGSVALGGAALTGRPAHAVAAAGVARTFQNIRLFNELSVLENVMAGHHLRERGGLLSTVLRLPASRRSERESRAAALALLERLGMAGLAGVEAGTLSYGDQRRVEIARALALEPQVLLLDEPAAGMNSAETAQLADFLVELRAAGLTLLVIEHDMDLIMRISDRVVVLNFGRLIAQGTPAEIRADRQVIEAYLGEETPAQPSLD